MGLGRKSTKLIEFLKTGKKTGEEIDFYLGDITINSSDRLRDHTSRNRHKLIQRIRKHGYDISLSGKKGFYELRNNK